MQHIVPNNVVRCCIEMLPAFGQACRQKQKRGKSIPSLVPQAAIFRSSLRTGVHHSERTIQLNDHFLRPDCFQILVVIIFLCM